MKTVSTEPVSCASDTTDLAISTIKQVFNEFPLSTARLAKIENKLLNVSGFIDEKIQMFNYFIIRTSSSTINISIFVLLNEPRPCDVRRSITVHVHCDCHFLTQIFLSKLIPAVLSGKYCYSLIP